MPRAKARPARCGRSVPKAWAVAVTAMPLDVMLEAMQHYLSVARAAAAAADEERASTAFKAALDAAKAAAPYAHARSASDVRDSDDASPRLSAEIKRLLDRFETMSELEVARRIAFALELGRRALDARSNGADK